MLGFIKDFFSKTRDTVSSLPATPPPGRAVDATPDVAPDANRSPTAPVRSSMPRAKARIERLLLSLKSITDSFPPELQPLLARMPSPEVIVALPADAIVNQLASGRAEVSLGDLRRVAPAGILSPDTSHDSERIEVPLREILSKLDLSLLKRQTRSRIELPPGIPDPFVRKAPELPPAPEPEGLRVNQEMLSATAEIQALFKEPEQETAEAAPQFEAVPVKQAGFGFKLETPAAEPVPVPEPTPEPIKPSGFSLKLETPAAEPIPVPEPTPEPIKPSGFSLKLETPAAEPVPVPEPTPEPVKPSGFSLKLETPPKPEPEPTPTRLAEDPKESEAPLVEPVQARTPEPVPAAGLASTINIPLCQVCGDWPEEIRSEIAGLGPESVIAFPLGDLTEAVKCGRVVMPWGRLRAWLVPALPAGDHPFRSKAVELPLSIVAPLLMTAVPRPQNVRKLEVDETLPSLFKPAAPSEPLTASLAVATEPAPPPAEPEAVPAVSNGGLPAELVERACKLNGVAGAVIALKDGMLVAANVPPEFNPETLAAFLPQVFSRLEQATTAMQIGALQSLMFTAGDRPWQIWDAGSIFFAALGRQNEMLPGAQLKVIAAQLARRSN